MGNRKLTQDKVRERYPIDFSTEITRKVQGETVLKKLTWAVTGAERRGLLGDDVGHPRDDGDDGGGREPEGGHQMARWRQGRLMPGVRELVPWESSAGDQLRTWKTTGRTTLDRRSKPAPAGPAEAKG